MNRTEALGIYAHAWQLHTPEDIRATLDRCWTPTSTYTDPITDPVTGSAELAAVIMDFGSRFTGAALKPTSELDTHHDVGRFTWTMTAPEPIVVDGIYYGTEIPGLDFLEFAEDGRIARVVGFFTPSPR